MQHRVEIFGLDVFDHNLAAGDCRETDEGRHLDVVGPDPVARATEAGAAMHAEHIRADAIDLGTHRHEEATEILHVWFTGSVDQRRVALGEHGGHHRVFGRGHAWLVHEEACAD